MNLISRWREFIEQVERGYPLGLEDYRNDLDLRAMLQGVEDEEVFALDQRLKALLVSTETRVWESAPENPFWDFGYPSNAGDELKDGLREEGLL
jgi:hypothetical protein